MLRKTLLATILTSLVIAAALPAFAEEKKAGNINWLRDYDKALAAAKEKDSPIIADFYTDWCGWCKRMDATTFQDADLAKYMEKYVALKIDAEDHRDLARKYRVRSYPTFLVLDSNGNLIQSLPGYRDADGFQKAIEDTLNGEDSLYQLQKAYKSGEATLQQMIMLSEKYALNQDVANALAVLRKVADKDLDNKEGFGAEAHQRIGFIAYQTRDYDTALKHFSIVDERFVETDVHAAASLGVAKSHQAKEDWAKAVASFKKFLERYPDHPTAEKVKREMEGIKAEKM